MRAEWRRRAASIVLSVGLAAAASACSLFQSDASKGRAIADNWCAECHRVAPDQPSGSRPGHILPPPVAAPSFMSVAARPGVDASELSRFMAELHLPMPIYRLSADEKHDVIQYILSLKPEAP